MRFAQLIFVIVTVFAVLLSVSACRKSGSRPIVADDDGYKPAKTAVELAAQLEAAPPDGFFRDWNAKVPVNTAAYINTNNRKDVYDVFRVVYKPFELLQLGNWEGGNSLNANCRYAVVQGKIYYQTVAADTLPAYFTTAAGSDSVTAFRPPVNLNKEQVLYLTDEYSGALNNYLGVTKDLPESERTARYGIIRPFIPIFRNHWFFIYHLATNPEVSMIVFNKNHTLAAVYFRTGYQGGEAMLAKTGGVWILTGSRETWIE